MLPTLCVLRLQVVLFHGAFGMRHLSGFKPSVVRTTTALNTAASVSEGVVADFAYRTPLHSKISCVSTLLTATIRPYRLAVF